MFTLFLVLGTAFLIITAFLTAPFRRHRPEVSFCLEGWYCLSAGCTAHTSGCGVWAVVFPFLSCTSGCWSWFTVLVMHGDVGWDRSRGGPAAGESMVVSIGCSVPGDTRGCCGKSMLAKLQSASDRAVSKPKNCLATWLRSSLFPAPAGPERMARPGVSESSQYQVLSCEWYNTVDACQYPPGSKLRTVKPLYAYPLALQALKVMSIRSMRLGAGSLGWFRPGMSSQSSGILMTLSECVSNTQRAKALGLKFPVHGWKMSWLRRLNVSLWCA